MDIWIDYPEGSLVCATLGAIVSYYALFFEGIIFLDPLMGKIICTRLVSIKTSSTQAQDLIGIIQMVHLLGVTLGLVRFILSDQLSEFSPLPADLNPDIVGRGVRFSVYGPAAGLVLSSFLGCFHVFDSAAKGLAMVQLFTLACYIVNAILPGPELKDPEILVVLLLAESTSSSLSIALNDKQVLSARMFVYAIVGAQLSMLGVMGWFVAHRSGYPVMLWFTYLAQALSVTRGVLRSVALTSAFNVAEREAAGKHRTTPPDTDLKSKRWLGIPIPCLLTASTPLKVEYSEQVATTSVAAFEFMVSTITSIISAERLMDQATPEGGDWTAWGQRAQVGITVLGLLHFLYTISYQLIYKRRGAFRWPRRFDEPMREYLRLLDSIPET